MNIKENKKEYKSFLTILGKIILILTVIQLFRASVMYGLWYVVKPGQDIILFQTLNGLSFLVVGILLLILIRPSLKELGLYLDNVKKRTKILYLLGGITLIIMIFLPYTFAYELDVLVLGMIFGLITPAFEELLFRGYLWNMAENSIKAKNKTIITWITITLMFGFWHLGYLDVFLIHPKGFDLIPLLMGKIMVGLILGAIVGFIRLKTKKVYGSFLFHGFWNTFAP
ncbi:MAG: CPBP family intramembrane metalloprotease [Methanobacterium sp.]|uniref:CPBP family intramembrane glutamic endopeptidase n=1 Tax=Methanobacterium sp. TaxID=2164 RepID=UPI003D654AD3|nr:CPBP family intramembrane metalloprotease [Methanobacterium sp.]